MKYDGRELCDRLIDELQVVCAAHAREVAAIRARWIEGGYHEPGFERAQREARDRAESTARCERWASQ